MSTLLACDRNLHLQCRMVRHADSRRPDAIPSPDKVAQHSLHLPHPPDARRQSRLPPLTAHTALVAGPAPRPALDPVRHALPTLESDSRLTSGV